MVKIQILIIIITIKKTIKLPCFNSNFNNLNKIRVTNTFTILNLIKIIIILLFKVFLTKVGLNFTINNISKINNSNINKNPVKNYKNFSI